jgi:hypothetical protein
MGGTLSEITPNINGVNYSFDANVIKNSVQVNQYPQDKNSAFVLYAYRGMADAAVATNQVHKLPAELKPAAEFIKERKNATYQQGRTKGLNSCQCESPEELDFFQENVYWLIIIGYILFLVIGIVIGKRITKSKQNYNGIPINNSS